MIDPKLLDYCQTDRQREILEALIRCGSKRAAAKELGSSSPVVRKTLYRVERYAAHKGYSPKHGIVHPLPEHLLLSGTSTLTQNLAGEPIWVKSSLDRYQIKEAMIATANALAEEIKPEEPVEAPKHVLDDLLSCYILTDYHLGQLSWAPETGEEWNLAIAEDLVYRWVSGAIKMVPPAKSAVLCILGDWAHYDSLTSETPAHRHVLQTDVRYGNLTGAAIRVVRRLVRTLLTHHENITLIIAEGNHDPAGSAWLRSMMAAFYEEEPRIFVNESQVPFYAVEFGDTSIYFHHGHTVKVKSVDRVFASQFRDIFGRTKHSYGHTGHLHHTVVESSLMIIEQHETLSARDAFAARGGLNAQRSAPVITYHKDHGEVYRHRMPLSLVKQFEANE